MYDDGLAAALTAFQQNFMYDENKMMDRKFPSWNMALKSLFPKTFNKPFSEPQVDYWNWVWAVKPGIRPRPYVLVLPRGGGKTTSCEITPILLGMNEIRNYCWYIQETQSQADRRISNIAQKLETSEMALHYPRMSERWIGKFGNVGGWRRSFVRTASNIVFEGVGLDKAMRSSKIGDERPNMIIVDDIDGKFDTERAVNKKRDVLTHTLLPAAAPNAVIVFVQNLVHYNSIATGLVDLQNTEFLQDRIISGPHPALVDFDVARMYDDNLEREIDKIVYGIPLWEGQGIDECQDYINTYGLTSFKKECQHEVEMVTGSVWADINFLHIDIEDVPDIVVGCVWCDPAVTNTETSSANGIQADGLGSDGHIYRFMSQEQRDSPLSTLRTALIWAVELGFDHVGVETDQGGKTWEVVCDTAWESLIEDPDHPTIGDGTPKPKFHEAKAGEGHGSKAHRNSLMLADYERRNVYHVLGFHKILESSLYRFLNVKPFDLADSAYWGWDFLYNEKWRGKVADAR